MSGYYIITSNLAGNLVLDVSGADFTKVITHRIHGSDNQLWTKQSTCGDLFYLVPKSNPTLKLAILVRADVHPCMLTFMYISASEDIRVY